MIIEADELDILLRREDDFIRTIKKRWGSNELSEQAEKHLRMGKRTELLGDLQCDKQKKEACSGVVQ